jgi:hypothetical protein
MVKITATTITIANTNSTNIVAPVPAVKITTRVKKGKPMLSKH